FVSVLPYWSSAVTSTVNAVPATTVVALGESVRCVAGPGANVTDAELANAFAGPPRSPVTEATPMAVPAVSVAEYVPFRLSVTAESEPDVVNRWTGPPLAPTGFPNWSSRVTVTAVVCDGPTWRLPLAVVIVDWASDAPAGSTASVEL